MIVPFGSRNRIARRGTRGQALTEFAIVLPVLLLLFMIVFDFGRAIFAYNTVSEAARNGGRVAMVNQTVQNIYDVAAGRAVALGIPNSCGGAGNPGVCVTFALAPDAPPNTTCPDVGCIGSVTVTYRYQPATPIIGRLIAANGITMTSTTQVPVERKCLPLLLLPGETACPLP